MVRPMLIDAFMYFNEIDLLEIRLNELNSIVDKFVIVESQEMHGSSELKRFNLKDNWNVVQPFEKKIWYTMLNALEPPFTGPESSWPRENYNRNALMQGIELASKSPNDIVMISDCDEIPKASAVKAAIPRIKQMYGTEQDFYYYNVNTFGGKWHGTVLGPLSEIIKSGGCQAVRNQRDNYPAIRDCGWHFSYFGGIDKIRVKVKNFAHASDHICQRLSERSDMELAQDILEYRDLYRRDGVNFEHREDDSRLPEFLSANKNRFKHFYVR
jgi:beta-1,4-mannosyl-glycoprotein beta-1,4-N-acetylglucosaminyltransferase